MTATPTREELVAAVEDALEAIERIQAALSEHAAQAALDRHDAADLALVRRLLDKHDVVQVSWELCPGIWYEDPSAERTGTHMPRRSADKHYCHLMRGSCNEEPCGTGATRSEALIDLARRWAECEGCDG